MQTKWWRPQTHPPSRGGFVAPVQLTVEGGGHELLVNADVRNVVVEFFRGTDVRAR